MASLLLIGGTGFFGKSFLDSFRRGLLSEWGIEKVIAMSRNADLLKVLYPDLITDRVELVNADISLVNALPRADIVIHAAASTDARNYLTRPSVEKNNIHAGVLNYVKLAPQYHSNSKVVYTSSGAVYGIQSKDHQFLVENDDQSQLNLMPDTKRDYAIAKHDAELVFEQLRGRCKNASIARCFAFVGPYLPLDRHFAVGNFIGDVINGKPITVLSKHRVFRSYMYSDDLVRWLLTIADTNKYTNETYNVGSDQPVLLHDLAKWMANEYSVDCKVEEITSADTDTYIPSTQKAASELGLTLRYDLQASIKKTIQILKSNT